MFNIIAKFFSSIVSFLFPLFASYKALKTSDPAQLTPWLMYWSVLSCALLAESWLEFILFFVPFYSWLRLGFLCWMVLPQTQGARKLYEWYLHPYLEQNEAAIEDFIASAHDRLKAAGWRYLRQAIELFRTRVLHLPPRPEYEQDEQPRAQAAPQGYTQALLARFSVPAARWAANNAGTAGNDFYNLLAGAVSAAATGAAAGARSAGSGATTGFSATSASGTLIPENVGGAQEKMNFIAAQKERLAFMMGALDKEAAQLESEQARKDLRAASLSLDGGQDSGTSRPQSGHSMWSGLSKSRSEVDFEKIDAPSGAEDEDIQEANMRRRRGQSDDSTTPGPSSGVAQTALNFLGWGMAPGRSTETGQSSGFEK
ncbi:TB2/DP1, HVA22 family-domain-containing protein [Xylariomycetidae sp. FL0641]|nr:TB2/DP1, HVA22 family-domain-containing protein [Xylariomycetidae sp. FL0641]